MYHHFREWYFVTKITLNYCKKKILRSLKVSESQKDFFLKLHCQENERNI